MSGHSKWAQTKHKKALTDAKRSKIFAKLAAAIAVAAREKGGNPDQNPKLRMAIEKARAFNMPQSNIERAIQRGTGATAGAALEELMYEAYGPEGVAILIQTVTENRNRTLGELRKILSEHGGKLAEAGSVKWLFEEKAVLKIPAGEWSDQLELDCIEGGAADIVRAPEHIAVYGAPQELNGIRNRLASAGLADGEMEKEFLPKSPLHVSDPETQKKLGQFFDALDEHADVAEIYSNAAFPS